MSPVKYRAVVCCLSSTLLIILGGCGGGSSSGSPTPSFQLSVQTTGAGIVSSNPAGINWGQTCTASFASGTQVTLTATPATSSSFAGWTGACSGTNSTCTVTLNANQQVTATFA